MDRADDQQLYVVRYAVRCMLHVVCSCNLDRVEQLCQPTAIACMLVLSTERGAASPVLNYAYLFGKHRLRNTARFCVCRQCAQLQRMKVLARLCNAASADQCA